MKLNPQGGTDAADGTEADTNATTNGHARNGRDPFRSPEAVEGPPDVAPPVEWWLAKQWADVTGSIADWPIHDDLGPAGWRELRDIMADRLGIEVAPETTFTALRIAPADFAARHAETTLSHAQIAAYADEHGLELPEVIAARLAEEGSLKAEKARDRLRAMFGGDPLPLTSGAQPAFPTDALPPYYRAYAEGLASSLEVNTALTGAFIMGALSAAVGGCVEMQIQSDRRENAVTHQGIVADPGERKSPALAAAVEPLLLATEVLADRAAADLPLLRLRAELAAKQFEADKKKYIKDVIDGTVTAPKIDAEVATDEENELLKEALLVPEVPTSPTIVYGGDITPEAIAVGLAENDERGAIMDAEGGVFDKLSGMYNRGVANIDIVLKGHSGDMHTVRRIGRETIVLHRPALSMCIALQPSKLDTLRRHPEMMGRGVIARMSFVLAPKVPNRRGWADPISEAVRTDYRISLRDLAVGLRLGGDPTKFVALDDKALVEFRRIAESIQRRLEGDGDLSGPMAWWGSKYAGLVARLALHLHMATYSAAGLEGRISVHTLRAALAIGEFYAAHTRAAVGLVHATDGTTLDEMTSALGWLHTCREKGVQPTTTRYSQNVKPDALRAADTRDRVLEALANLHHVVVRSEPGIKGGKVIYLHPDSTRP